MQKPGAKAGLGAVLLQSIKVWHGARDTAGAWRHRADLEG